MLIVVIMAAGSDYRKQAQFKQLLEFGKSLNVLTVIRGGQSLELNAKDILVGDVVVIQTGVVLPVDGILIKGYGISCDESAMTGEPFAIEKNFEQDPFLLSGTSVVNGVGEMLVIGTVSSVINFRVFIL